jgi:RNA polymerase sigma-70 factor, ECF subfamily
MRTTSGSPARLDGPEFVEALRRGDELAFGALLDAYSSSLLRAASAYVSSRAVAEEVVQETWLGVIGGLDRFEGRSALGTWIFRILANVAARRAARESRSVPFSSLAGDDDGSALDPDRFLPSDHAPYPGHWAIGPTAWETPEEGLLAGETREVILSAIDELPDSQRAVITLRDVEGREPAEVHAALSIGGAGQRVLLNRARAKVRAAVERYYDAVELTVQPVA